MLDAAPPSTAGGELSRDDAGVWVPADPRPFAYSDGADSERYLEQVLGSARDLGSRSVELEAAIRDWPSEYHLTPRRAQLLSAFAFDPRARVLEVGGGCGAITRHLGERFANVVSVEGSLARARLARLRTRDQPHVEIVCAPFQEVSFRQRFDIVFCIGVLEYAADFVSGDDPYDAAVACFAGLLEPDGLLVVAIENQFGLKYWSGAGEDHVGRLYEGIEGYHRSLARVRTFGKPELDARLRRHFAATAFHYPYPDYKLPQCVLDDAFAGSPRAGEMVAGLRWRDYGQPRPELCDTAAASLELARNGLLGVFANSFLVVASRGPMPADVFPQAAATYSKGRVPAFSTITRIVRGPDGRLEARKRRLLAGAADHPQLRLVEESSPWVDGASLHTTIALRAKRAAVDLATIFEPCRRWLEHLVSESNESAGRRWLPGAHVDSTWRNCFLSADGCRLIDREWVWHAPVPLHVVVIRAVHQFVYESGQAAALPGLQRRSAASTVRAVAGAFGVELSARDFDDFVELESSLISIVLGRRKARHALRLRWQLADEPSLRTVLDWRWRADLLGRKAGQRIARLAARAESASR